MMKASFEMSINAPRELRKIRKQYYPYLVKCFGIDQLLVDASISEAVNNAWKHGNQENSDKKIHVKIVFLNSRMVVRINDQGPGFDWKPYHVSSDIKHWFPDVDHLEENGRGIILLLRVMDHLRYNNKGNECLLMKKYVKQV